MRAAGFRDVSVKILASADTKGHMAPDRFRHNDTMRAPPGAFQGGSSKGSPPM